MRTSSGIARWTVAALCLAASAAEALPERAPGAPAPTVPPVPPAAGEAALSPRGGDRFPPECRGFLRSGRYRLAAVYGTYALSHASSIESAAFSGDGQRLYTGGWDGRVRAWDATDGHELWSSTVQGGVNTLAVSRDEVVFLGCQNGFVAAIDGATGRLRWRARAKDQDDVRAVAVSANGRRAVSAGYGTLVAWGLDEGKQLRVVARGSGLPDWIWLSPDGTLAFWFPHQPHGQDLRGAFDLDRGERAADAQLEPFQAALSEAEDYRLKLVALPQAGGPRLVHVVSPGVAVFDGGRRAAVPPLGESRNRLELWDLLRGKRLVSADGHADAVRAVDVTPDGQWVLSVGANGSMMVRAAATGAVRWSTPGTEGGIAAASFADGGRVLSVEGITASSIEWIDAANGRPAPNPAPGPGWGAEAIRTVSPGGRFAAVLEPSGRLAVVNAVTGKALWRFDPSVTVMALSARGDLLAARGNALELRDVRGTPIAVVADAGQLAGAVVARFAAGAVSASGDAIAVATPDGRVRLWDVAAGAEVDQIDLSSSADRATALAFSPDGAALVVGTARGMVLRFERGLNPRAE